MSTIVVTDLTPAQWTIAKAMMEATLEEHVRTACLHLRLMRYHTHRSQYSAKGFPDDVIMGSRGIIYRECKREGFDPTADQQKWLDGLAEHGHDVGVWRPSDWLSGRIMAELTELTGASTRR